MPCEVTSEELDSSFQALYQLMSLRLKAKQVHFNSDAEAIGCLMLRLKSSIGGSQEDILGLAADALMFHAGFAADKIVRHE